MGGVSGVKDLVFRAYRVRARYSDRTRYRNPSRNPECLEVNLLGGFDPWN
jgi:hypothetical protein